MATTTRRKPTARRTTKEIGGTFPAESLYGQHKRYLAMQFETTLESRRLAFANRMRFVIEQSLDDCDYYRLQTTKIVEQQRLKPERDRLASKLRKCRKLIHATCKATADQLAEQRQRAEAKRSRQLVMPFAL